MNWKYRDINITIDSDGWFVFNVYNKEHRAESLKNAEKIIDEKLIRRFDSNDLQTMFLKLNSNEQRFVKELILELSRHCFSNCCEMGISDEFPFDFDFSKFSKKYETD